jgi:putative sterol carrier protein
VSRLAAAAEHFVAVYHARPPLVAEQAGWRCVIGLRTTEGHAVTVRVEDGRITAVAVEAEPADLVVTADADTLEDILRLRRSPNEPYLFGELTVQGPERDFLRLDYIATRLCPQ